MDKIEKILNRLNTTDYDEVFENIDEAFEKQKMNITKYLSGVIGYRFGTDITKIETYSSKDAYTDHCNFNTLESLGSLSEEYNTFFIFE